MSLGVLGSPGWLCRSGAGNIDANAFCASAAPTPWSSGSVAPIASTGEWCVPNGVASIDEMAFCASAGPKPIGSAAPPNGSAIGSKSPVGERSIWASESFAVASMPAGRPIVSKCRTPSGESGGSFPGLWNMGSAVDGGSGAVAPASSISMGNASTAVASSMARRRWARRDVAGRAQIAGEERIRRRWWPTMSRGSSPRFARAARFGLRRSTEIFWTPTLLVTRQRDHRSWIRSRHEIAAICRTKRRRASSPRRSPSCTAKPFAVGASVGTSRTAEHTQKQNGDIYIPLNSFTVPRGQLAVGDRVSGLMVPNPAANARNEWRAKSIRHVEKRSASGAGPSSAGGAGPSRRRRGAAGGAGGRHGVRSSSCRT